MPVGEFPGMHLASFGPKPELTVIVPCFNEEVVLPETARRLTASLEQIGCSFEIIFVDDGSRDGTPQVLTGLHTVDPRLRIVRLSRNFGHQIALPPGLEYARGAAVVLIDADLQDPPEVIGEMVALWRQGNDVVYGTRSRREGETAFKTLTAKWFYRFINRLSEIEIPLDSGDFRLLDRKVVDALVSMPERDRFVRGMVSWTGFCRFRLRLCAWLQSSAWRVLPRHCWGHWLRLASVWRKGAGSRRELGSCSRSCYWVARSYCAWEFLESISGEATPDTSPGPFFLCGRRWDLASRFRLRKSRCWGGSFPLAPALKAETVGPRTETVAAGETPALLFRESFHTTDRKAAVVIRALHSLNTGAWHQDPIGSKLLFQTQEILSLKPSPSLLRIHFAEPARAQARDAHHDTRIFDRVG